MWWNSRARRRSGRADRATRRSAGGIPDSHRARTARRCATARTLFACTLAPAGKRLHASRSPPLLRPPRTRCAAGGAGDAAAAAEIDRTDQAMVTDHRVARRQAVPARDAARAVAGSPATASSSAGTRASTGAGDEPAGELDIRALKVPMPVATSRRSSSSRATNWSCATSSATAAGRPTSPRRAARASCSCAIGACNDRCVGRAAARRGIATLKRCLQKSHARSIRQYGAEAASRPTTAPASSSNA